MRDIDNFAGLSGWLVLILIIYTVIRDRKPLYRFIKNTIKYEWWKEPKNRKQNKIKEEKRRKKRKRL